MSLGNLNRYEEAIALYDKALEIDPEYAIALTNKALAIFHIGERDEAFMWIDKALTIDPTNKQILDVKSQMQECC